MVRINFGNGNKNEKSEKEKHKSSFVVDKKIHRRIRELTDFNHGGFAVFLNTSLRVFLPFVESYYLERKRSLKGRDVLQSIIDDVETQFDYETIGRNFVSAIQGQTGGGFDDGK
jgi:hypothetical protein